MNKSIICIEEMDTFMIFSYRANKKMFKGYVIELPIYAFD